MNESAIVIIQLILKIVGTTVCVNKAKELNRSTIGWGFFGFIAPIIAMIWIHCLKPLIKTKSHTNNINFQELRKKSVVHETKSAMHDMIISDKHDSSRLDENPDGKGEFGLVKTNPIPVYGIDNIPAYMDKLRYKYTSKSGTSTFHHIDFVRISDFDQSSIGSKRPNTDPFASSTSSPNINGHIDVYNLYSIGGEKLAKIYINCYSLKTSDKIINGFIHRDKVPAERDSKALMEAMKKV